MNPSDFCNVIFLLFTSCFIYVNNKIFVLFVSSKPDGRKTVLGRIPRIYQMLKQAKLSCAKLSTA